MFSFSAVIMGNLLKMSFFSVYLREGESREIPTPCPHSELCTVIVAEVTLQVQKLLKVLLLTELPILDNYI